MNSWTHVIAFGGNIRGTLGVPRETFSRVIEIFLAEGIEVIAVSRPVETRAVGGKTRIPYLNAALLVRSPSSPAALLRLLKRTERAAGRRTLARNASRPLDLDILLWRGGASGFSRHGRRMGMVQVPHPELHKRAFMMVPLTEVLPHWWHPGFRCAGRRLLRRIRIKPGDVGGR